MTDDEQQQIAQAIARAFETLSERLSRELEDALNQTARVMERAQKQQYEMMSVLGKQAAAMEALADFVAKVRNEDVDRHNKHNTAIEQLSQGQMKIAQFTDGLATQYGQLFKALSNRLDAASQLNGESASNCNSSPGAVQGPGIRGAPWPQEPLIV